jgi:biopolymer transport protein ExbB
MLSRVSEFFVSGGIWMYPIVAVSFLVIAIGVERAYALYFRYNVDAGSLMAQVQRLVMSNNIERAIKLCNAVPQAALPHVVKAALMRANRGETEIANALEEASVDVLRHVQKRVSMLPSLANMATLLGLLGTIVGLIEAFRSVASAPPDMKSQLLTQSLAIGLNTTALGLCVAIPALGLYMWLSAQARKIVEDVDQYSLKLQNLLVARSKLPPVQVQVQVPVPVPQAAARD